MVSTAVTHYIAAWLAFVVGLMLGGAVADLVSFAVAAALGAVLVGVGFAAAGPVRSVPSRRPVAHLRVMTLALGVGVAMGLANLAANWGIAQIDPSIRAALEDRFHALSVLDAVVVAPLTEEIPMRLFFMSVLAWIVFRTTRRASLAFVVALVGSSMVFAALHLARPLPGDEAVATYYRAALLAKYTGTGVPLGWLFWRYGLPYAIAGHAAANAAHLVAQPVLF